MSSQRLDWFATFIDAGHRSRFGCCLECVGKNRFVGGAGRYDSESEEIKNEKKKQINKQKNRRQGLGITVLGIYTALLRIRMFDYVGEYVDLSRDISPRLFGIETGGLIPIKLYHFQEQPSTSQLDFTTTTTRSLSHEV